MRTTTAEDTPGFATSEVEVPGAVPLSAVLRLPTGTDDPGPGLLFTGPFTGVKEQVVGRYAEALAGAGFATLTFDHSHFGGSAGEPRQHEDSDRKLDDLRRATSFLAAHDQVDAERLGCVGICLGGGYALRHSAFDPRIRAVAMVAAGFNDPRLMRDGMGADSYRAMMADFARVEQEQHLTGQVAYLAAVSADPEIPAAMAGAEPFAYYGTPRGAAPGWSNRITRLSIRSLLTFDAAIGAEFLSPTPALIVHGRRDEFCSPDQAQRIYDRLDHPKELLWLDTTNHIDLYDQPAFVDPAVAAVRRWMGQYL